MKQRSGSSSLSALKLKSFSSLVKWWARIIHVTWKVTCLYGIFTGCVWMHAQIPENHWQCECSKSDDPGTNAATHYPCIFRNLCVKGALAQTFGCFMYAISICYHFSVWGTERWKKKVHITLFEAFQSLTCTIIWNISYFLLLIYFFCIFATTYS